MFLPQSQFSSSDSCYVLIAGIKARLKSTNRSYLMWLIAKESLSSCQHDKNLILQPDTQTLFISWQSALLTECSFLFCCVLLMPFGLSSPCLLLACRIVCKHKPIPLRCFSRLQFQVPAWAPRLWWWAMCKAAFSNLIKAQRYSPLKQRALEAWRNDSGKSTALICKNLHLLAGTVSPGGER